MGITVLIIIAGTTIAIMAIGLILQNKKLDRALASFQEARGLIHAGHYYLAAAELQRAEDSILCRVRDESGRDVDA